MSTDRASTWLAQPNRTTADVESEYDALAPTYEEDIQRWGWDTPEICARMLRHHTTEQGVIIDVGCGTGLSGLCLRRQGFETIDGADISQQSLALAGDKEIYRELYCCDLLKPLPWASDNYSGVCCSGVLSNIPDINFLRELCRIVRPGGVIVCSHREDLAREDNFEGRVETLSREGQWVMLESKLGVPYLPGKEDYARAGVKAHYYALRVSPGAQP